MKPADTDARGSTRPSTPPLARVLRGMSDIDATGWDLLVPPGSGALTHDYVTAWEQVELAGLRSAPIVAYRPGVDGPVAACPGHWYDLDLVATRIPQATPVLRILRRAWPSLLMARAYELGSPTPLTNPFLVADADMRDIAVPAMVDAALAEADRHDAQFMYVQTLTSLDGPAARLLIDKGFAAIPVLPTVVLDLRYRTFDEYLGAMRSQYRRRAHHTLKESSHLKIEQLRQFADLADELTVLWRRVYDRAREVRHEILTADYFRAMSDLDAASVLVARRENGSIASFALLLDDRPSLEFLHCGFEADSGREEGAYFRLLYEIARVGIEGGFADVELGLTTIEPKLDIGGVPIPLYALVRHRRRSIHRLVRALANRGLRSPTPQPRRVFKEPPPSAAELAARRETWDQDKLTPPPNAQ